MHKKIRILILGASGQVGGHLIKALKSDVSLEVVAAARNGAGEKADEVFDNFPALVGRQPRLLPDFVRHHADQFRY